MYLAELKLWNFRKYGDNSFELEKPHLVVPFKKGLNVLVGENDSGKSAILDAIKIALKTHAIEWVKVDEEDFYNESSKLRIELVFKGLEDAEAKNFIEWLGWEENETKEQVPILKLIYQVEYKNNRIIPTDISAGMDDFGSPLNAEAKEYLKITYLKALRDADNELIAKKNSRLSQILKGHHLFQEKLPHNVHKLTNKLNEFNEEVKKWFEDDKKDSGKSKSNKEEIKDIIDEFIGAFIDQENNSSNFTLFEPNIISILEKITLGLSNVRNPGLGTLNRLYMAAELLHLKRRDWNGVKLCLIEELEAHLHPQAQMKIVEKLQTEAEKANLQIILTTHSPNLASKVKIENLILCNSNRAYSLDVGNTRLDKDDYKYLKRFLDVTKSNLFFAKGVIIVEGWSEEILIPVLAKKIGCDLTQNEVSIVNVGSTAYLHFAKIFLRKDSSEKLDIPVSIITDLDVRPDETDGQFNTEEEQTKESSIKADFKDFNDSNVKIYIAKQWTLEWCIFKSSLSDKFKEIIANVHSGTEEFKKDENDKFSSEFETKLIDKLKKSKGSSGLDKVRLATELAESLEYIDITIDEGDEYLDYLIEAIKHACKDNGNK
ncbi:MAG: AAA family ATPase [Candidatus Dojkabacteria bacterium]|nr:AAA family ATPase [Candidatus Dojkabacteria bacterium]